MNARYYTLAEARAMLPRVKEAMTLALRARQAIIQLRPDAWPAISKASTNGGSRAAGELAIQIGYLESAVKEIMKMGILIKDLDAGVIDFLGRREGREIYLCWRAGEETIE